MKKIVFISLIIIIIIIIIALFPMEVLGQEVAVKTNLIYWGTTTSNLSLEWAPSYKVSLDFQGSYNSWDFGSKESNRKIKHWLIQPELRFWIHEAFDGHFLGVHPFYGKYNIGNINLPLGIFNQLKENRYEGYGAGVGVSYGYQWYLGHHWNSNSVLVGHILIIIDLNTKNAASFWGIHTSIILVPQN